MQSHFMESLEKFHERQITLFIRKLTLFHIIL